MTIRGMRYSAFGMAGFGFDCRGTFAGYVQGLAGLAF